MPLPNSSARGFGACSTSYAPDNGCRSPWCSAVRSQRLCRRKTKCSRRKTLAAKPEERETWTDGKITGADYGQTSTQRLFEGEAELAQYGQARTTTEFVKASKFDADHIRHRVPLLDEKKRYDWAESIESSNDWQSFFRDDGFDFEDPELDDTYDGLKTGSSANTDLVKKAWKAIGQDLTSPEWRARHPNYTAPAPVPSLKKYFPDIPDPELVPHRDWDEFALRAWVEKRRQKEKTDVAWKKRQDAIGRFSVLNVTEENDTRLEPGWTTTPRTWSHEEIWDLILNGGVSAHPDDVKALKIQDPEAKADYFVEGVHYIPETEQYLASIGHWWEDDSEPDVANEVTLASEFSDFDVEPAADGDQDNDDEAAGPDDEATQLGKFFSGDM